LPGIAFNTTEVFIDAVWKISNILYLHFGDSRQLLHMKRIYEILVVSIIFVIVCFIYKSQQRITLHDGKAWDGVYYYSMVEQIQQGASPVVGDLPFIKRLGTPFLIAYFSKFTGKNILDSALYVNLAGSFLTVILLLLWLGFFVKQSWIKILLCFLFMMVWYVLIRYSFYCPLASDAWGAPWFVGGLLLLESIRKSNTNNKNAAFAGYMIAYSLVIAVGNFFRESNAVLCLLPFFVFNPLNNIHISPGNMKISDGMRFLKKTWQLYFVPRAVLLFIPVLCIALTNSFINKHIVVNDPKAYSYLLTVIAWVYTKSLPEYLLGICIAYGPLILLVIFFYKEYKALLWERQELFFLLGLSLLLGFIGGSDTERIMFMSGFPIILLLIGISIKTIFDSPQRWWLYVLFVLQAISFRFFWNLPDVTPEKLHTPLPVFGLMSSHFPLLNLYSHFGDYKVNAILLAEYIGLFLATWYVLHHKVVLRKSVAE